MSQVPKIIDFNIAARLQDGDPGTLPHTTGKCGTPGFMSPECERGEERDVRSDLYSLGVTLEEMYDSDMGCPEATQRGITDMILALRHVNWWERPDSFEQIKGMAVFAGMDWDAVEDGTLAPPESLRELAQRRVEAREAVEGGPVGQVYVAPQP
jgi:serine/threonine protein kinase